MRVVLDGRVASDHFPGIGRVAVGLAEALTRVAPELDLVVLEDASGRTGARKEIHAPRAAAHAPVFSLAQQWAIPTLLRRLRAELYHSLYFLMPYCPGVPAVFTCHDLIPLRRPDLFPARKRAVFTLAHRAALAASRFALVPSEATATDLETLLGVGRARIRVVPNGVDATFHPATEAELAALRSALVLPREYYLFVGSNRPHKNLPRLVEAFARARGRLGDRSPGLVVAGPWDPRYPEARALAGALAPGAVTFVGIVDDRLLPALYGGAIAFAFPSEIEGFGLPVLEAMACGTPSVTARGTSLEEIAGDAALLVDPNDVDGLAAALLELATKPELREVLRARGTARATRYSWDEAARTALAVYREAVAPSGPGKRA